MFADDTNYFIQGNDKNTLFNTLNTELNKISKWLHVNKLSLNVGKSHYILFNAGRKSVSYDYDIKLDGLSINRVNSIKYLGVDLDQHLT